MSSISGRRFRAHPTGDGGVPQGHTTPVPLFPIHADEKKQQDAAALWQRMQQLARGNFDGQ